MGYEILSNDLFEEGSSKPKPKKHNRDYVSNSSNNSSSKPKKKDGFKFNPMYIHLGIIVIAIILLILFFSNNIDFGKKEKVDTIVFVGDLKNFNESYNGTFSLYSSEFIITTKKSKFEVKSSDIVISNFTGRIYSNNDSIFIVGLADKIEFDDNELDLDAQSFTLRSTKKTNMNLYFDKLSLDFNEGRVKLNDEFNYEFINTTVNVVKFNTSINYDGVFSFSGVAKEFSLNSKNPNLAISYQNVK